jgi:rubrerythrin
MSEQLFYLQDSRSFVGNDVVWWGLNGNGYTTDLSKAQTYSKDQAQRMHTARPSDIPWPKDYIDAKTRPAVDFQYIKRAEALEGSGIEIVQPAKPKPERLNCHKCGSFLSAAQLWDGSCPRCGADNRP